MPTDEQLALQQNGQEMANKVLFKFQQVLPQHRDHYVNGFIWLFVFASGMRDDEQDSVKRITRAYCEFHKGDGTVEHLDKMLDAARQEIDEFQKETNAPGKPGDQV